MTTKKHPSCEIVQPKVVPTAVVFAAGMSASYLLKSQQAPSDKSADVLSLWSSKQSSLTSEQTRYNGIYEKLSKIRCPLPDVEDKDA
jgi:hypothetical protein